MRQRGSIELILIFVVLLAIVGGGAYYFGTKGERIDDFGTPIFNPSEDKKEDISKMPENDETANWKTYTNNAYGFSLKYPQELSLEIDDTSSWKFQFISPEGCNPLKAECKKALTVQILENPKDLSLQEFYKTSSDYNIFASGEGKKTILAGLQAYKFGADDNYARIVAYKNRIYTIQDFARTFQENGTFDRILSTFKFTP